MPTLTLEPDEVLPNTPAPLEGEASGPFPIFWRGKERQFLLRAVEILPKRHVIFAREVGNDEAGNWLIYERNSMKPAKWSPDRPRKIFENFEREFATRNWTLGRFFADSRFFNKVTIGVLLAENSVGVWLDKELRTSAFFDFEFPVPVFVSHRNQVQQFYKQESANPYSTISFAARWKPCHNKDRAVVLLGDRNAEIMEVMRWILVCEPRLWERDNSWKWSFRPFTRFGDFSSLLCKHGSLPLYLFKHIADKMPQTHQLMLFLGRQYLKIFVESLSQTHRCIKEGWELEIIEIHLEVEGPPTARERREAALNLRDWLQKHEAPAELLALLRL